ARPSRARRVTRAGAAVALAAVAVPVVARATGFEAGPVAILVALMPWVTVAALLTVLLAGLARAPWVLGASAAVAALCVAWQVPLFVAEPSPQDGDQLTVASVNMTFGGADAEEVVHLVREHQVDVLAVQELTPEAVRALGAAGLDDLLPHSEVHAEPGFTGGAVWSRLPLTGGRAYDGLTSTTVLVEVEAAFGPLAVVAPHPAAPGPVDHEGWSRDLRALGGIVDGIDGPLLVLGDLNATRDHRAYRDLEHAGLVNAATQAGAGLKPTFPEGRLPIPVVAIDHAMVRDAPLIAVQVHAVPVAGADHRALVATYAYQ
ncbi:MAG: endonuclease/exonuclease/phosphatase family protein, partial [Demequina sp.]